MNPVQIKSKHHSGLAALLCTALFTFPALVQAFGSYTTDWNTLYASSTSADNASCQLCHDSSSGTVTWNAYGWEIRGDSGINIQARIGNVEGSNSDGDPLGSSNIDEINADTQPGWTDGANNSVYNSGGLISGTSTAPGNITGNLDIPAFTVGGSISGLTGSVTLRNNNTDDLTLTVNGAFTFATALADGSGYAVSVFAQPNGQTCAVAQGSGTLSAANVDDVIVTCVDDAVPTFSVGGSISGLIGSVTLRNNNTDDLTRTVNGAFTFANELADSIPYDVSVFAQPGGQTCSVVQGSGIISGADVNNVSVTCVNAPDPTYSVGGTINGLMGSVILLNNGTDELARSTNGGFTFTNELLGQATYTVTVKTQPVGQDCSVTGGSGTIAAANVSNVTVNCSNILGVANVEWTVLPAGSPPGDINPIPALGNTTLLLIVIALLFFGIRKIRRQQSTVLKMLAFIAISLAVLISTPVSYHIIDMARAATSILLTTSPEPLELGDNTITNTQGQRIQITALGDSTCLIDQSMADAPACAVGTVLQSEESCRIYVSCDGGTPKSPSPDSFLQFPSPIADPETAANEYYQVIDPGGNKDTLGKWKTSTGFNGGYDSMAVYVNDTDLGFGRRMFVRKNIDGSVASYVENYPTLQNAIEEQNLIATVAMEYSDPESTGTKFTQFYTFDPNGNRLLAVDLDGRGARFQPGVCNTCHGGSPKASYPDAQSADTGAGFLPWDLDTFVYATTPDNLSRMAQAGEFKKFNHATLDTNPTDAARELIEGWYGGAGLPGDFDSDFVPALWGVSPVDENDIPVDVAAAKALYQGVVAPYCRACHIQQTGTAVPDFASYKQFDQYRASIESRVFDQGSMPLALRTFEKFWHNPDSIDLLADFLGINPEPNPHLP